MKIELLNTDEFIRINHLRPVTSPVLFQRGNIPHPEGLVSMDIFGSSPKDRKETFAYIDLGHPFFHPHVYKIMLRFFRNVEKIIDGSAYYRLNEEGHLILSDEVHGKTGLKFLYDNWEKIKWDKTDSEMRNQRIDIVTKTPKNEIFMTKQIVIPAFYRDVATSSGGGGSVQEINTFYQNLIRLSSILRENDVYSFSLYSTQAAVQQTIVSVYNYFKEKLESKNGMLRKYLMGKNVDFCTRSVITAAPFHADRPEQMQVNLHYSGIPIAQALALCQPYILHYVSQFFEQEVFTPTGEKRLIDPTTGKVLGTVAYKNPQFVFTDKYIRTRMNTFIKDPETRFDPIEIPLQDGGISYLSFHGRRTDLATKDELSSIMTRKMTWTDLFFMAAVDATKDKHCLVTRYPLIDQYGVFTSRVRILSTTDTVPMQVGETVYPFYPNVDLVVPRNAVASKFIDSVQFSNSYLPGLDRTPKNRRGKTSLIAGNS